MMQQAVEDRRREDLVAEDSAHWVTTWFVVMSKLPRVAPRHELKKRCALRRSGRYELVDDELGLAVKHQPFRELAFGFGLG